MVKASMVMMAVLAILIFMGLGWRERRMTASQPPQPRPGWFARQKAQFNRAITAAAIAAVGTSVILGGLHWLRVMQG
jgi:hypothetical protein